MAHPTRLEEIKAAFTEEQSGASASAAQCASLIPPYAGSVPLVVLL
jgi:hypothetical protein